MDEAPDVSQRSVLDAAFYEWLLSDQPLATAQRCRRREESFARRAAERRGPDEEAQALTCYMEFPILVWG